MAKKKAQKPREMTRRQLSHHALAQRRQRIVMYSGIGIIVIVIALVAVGLIQGVILPRNATVLKINDRSFNLDYFTTFLEQMAANSPDKSLSTLAPQVMQQIQTVELLRQGAEKLGVTVASDNVSGEIKNRGLPDNEVIRDLVRYELLSKELTSTYFADQVQDPAPQANVQGLLLEDATVAAQVRPLLMAADNITPIVEQYGLNYYSQNAPYGDFGWHPENVLKAYLGSQIPLDYAFGAQAGDVSGPLSDNATSKKLGYWMLRVNALNIPEATGNTTPPVTANITGVLLGSRAEALVIQARLNAGEDIAPIAAQNPNFSLSQQRSGEIGLLTKPAEGSASPAISATVDAVIFSPDTPIGVWLDPIQDDEFYTKGGAWIIKVVDTSPSRALSEDDRTTLINDSYNTWVQGLASDPSFAIDQSLTSEQQTQAIEQAAKDLQRNG